MATHCHDMLRKTHGLRNEMYIREKKLDRPTQCSRFGQARDQKDLVLLEREGQQRMVTSHPLMS
jgi:hypothetical protein